MVILHNECGFRVRCKSKLLDGKFFVFKLYRVRLVLEDECGSFSSNAEINSSASNLKYCLSTLIDMFELDICEADFNTLVNLFTLLLVQ